MTAGLLAVTSADDEELRAFLASYGVMHGWCSWSCACGVEGDAPDEVTAWRVLRVHVVSAHVAAGDTARAMAANLRAALADTPQ